MATSLARCILTTRSLCVTGLACLAVCGCMDLSGYEHGTSNGAGGRSSGNASAAGVAGVLARGFGGVAQGGANAAVRSAGEGGAAGTALLRGGDSGIGSTTTVSSSGGGRGGGGGAVCTDGAEGCRCNLDGTCRVGLTCAANRCVAAGQGGATGNGGAGPLRGGAGGMAGVAIAAGRNGQGGSSPIAGRANSGGAAIAGAATTASGGSSGAMSSGGSTVAGTTGTTVSGAAGGMGIGGTAGAGSLVVAGAGTAGNGTAGVGSGGAPPCATFATTGCSYVPPSPPSCPSSLTALCRGESCCTAIAMPGGTFPMGRTSEDCGPTGCQSGAGYEGCPVGASCDLTNERPEHNATVSGFALDKYEVTVGRFRVFVNAYDEWHRSLGYPKDNDGVHPIADNTGWGRSWTATLADLPDTASALKSTLACDNYGNNTWTSQAVSNESYPINCVSWYVAFAFCIWDGGRLPTEAEWEYAAAGGSQNRLYPWGSAAPDSLHANYSESTPGGTLFFPVGSKLPTGAGFFGHADLAGSVAEWVFDWFDHQQYYHINSCDNCVNADPSNTYRGCRGGGWAGGVNLFRVAARTLSTPADPYHALGFRCARKSP